MKNILDEDKNLHDLLKNIPPQHWSRAYFTGRAKCDMLLNNICEVFNKQLVQGRDKPVITCLEFIREYLMKRIVMVHKMQANCNGPLTPFASRLFENIKNDASSCNVIWCGPNKYQVTGPHIIEQRIVTLDKRSCSCRRWDLTCIPCRHAVACIWDMGLHGLGDGIPEKYVDKVYWLETWKTVYANTIEPINGMDMWPTSACPTTLVSPNFISKLVDLRKRERNLLLRLKS
ncbi:putative Zinc finger, SWIM-type [Helianthus annuus]|nr:putative Zinc finger, SWIM-type [Helianthus annuus]